MAVGLQVVCVEKHRVTLFLFRAKGLIQAGTLVISSRRKNMDALAQLGLLYVHQLEMLKGLTYHDYFNTLPETINEPEAWEFGIDVQGNTIYIKLAVVGNPTCHEHLACISFHLATGAIVYPYKK
jgi:hypothetical protein